MHRLAFLFSLLLLLPRTPQAQQPIEFDHVFGVGSPQSDEGLATAIDEANNLYVVGTSEWGGGAFLSKYRPDGTLVWTRAFGQANATPTGNAVGRLDDVYVSGTFTGSATWRGGGNPPITLTSRGESDAFLAKYDSDGLLQWVDQAGGTGADTGEAVASSEGDVLLAGGFSETATFGDGTDLTSEGGTDAFLARYAPDGSLQWVRSGGGLEDDVAYAVTDEIFQTENVYIAGSFAGEAAFGFRPPLTSAGLDDLFVVRYDQDGHEVWSQRIGGPGMERATGIAAYYSVYVTGSFEDTLSVGAFDLMSEGGTDLLVASLNWDGDVRGGFRAGGSGMDEGTGIRVAPGGGGDIPGGAIYVSGIVTGDGSWGDVYEGVRYLGFGGRDGLLLGSFDFPAGGDFVLSGRLTLAVVGGSGEDGVVGLGMGKPLRSPLAATGFFSGEMVVGGQTLTSRGDRDLFVGYMDRTFVGTASEHPTPLALSAPSPNPTAHATAFTLTLPTSQLVRAEVFDPLGRRVARLHDGPLAAGRHTLRWDAARAPAGLYVVRVVTETETSTRRVVRVG